MALIKHYLVVRFTSTGGNGIAAGVYDSDPLEFWNHDSTNTVPPDAATVSSEVYNLAIKVQVHGLNYLVDAQVIYTTVQNNHQLIIT